MHINIVNYALYIIFMFAQRMSLLTDHATNLKTLFNKNRISEIFLIDLSRISQELAFSCQRAYIAEIMAFS